MATLLDGDPSNNFLERALAFNPDGILRGAVNIAIAGTYAYILADRGMVVVDLNEPLQPTGGGDRGGARPRQAAGGRHPVPLRLRH